jgi:hypothetical protein
MKPIDRINHFRARLKTFALSAAMFAGAGMPSRAELVGHWLSGPEHLQNGASTGSAHDGVAVANPGGIGYSTDLPPGFTDPAMRSVSFSNGAAVEIANTSTSDAGYLNTFDEGTSSQLTVAFWAKGFPGDWSPWLGKDGEGAGWQVRRIGGSSGAGFTLRGQPNDNGGDSPINVNNANWHHYAAVWDASTTTRTLYVDGVFSHAITTGDATIDLATGRHLVLGGRQNNPTGFSHYFTGNLFDVRIYDNALSQQNVVDLIPLGPPQGLVATPGSGRVSLSWSPVPLATEYTVSTMPTAGGTPVTEVVTEPSFVKESLTNGVSYDFQVLATKSSGNGPYSDIVSVTPAPSPAKDILTFDIDGVPENVVISNTDIMVYVPGSLDVTGLLAYYTVSAFASGDVNYPSGSDFRDFSTPQTYTITAEDFSTKTYTVTVIHADPVIYDFNDGLQGWTQLWPVVGTLPLWQDWNSGGLGTPEGPAPLADDAETRFGRSPDFYLDPSGPLTFQLAGGQGNLATPGVPPSDIPEQSVSNNGFSGVALRDVLNDTYVLSKRRDGNGANYASGSFTAAELAPYANDGRRYTLDFIDYNRGGWGWTRLDNVSIPGELAPPIAPAPQANVTSFTYLGAAAISDTDITIRALPFGSSVTALAPTYTLSDGATCDIPSGSVQDFTNPVTYTVTSAPANESGPQIVKEYTVSVLVMPDPATALVGHWVSGAESLADTSGHAPGVHNGMAVGSNAGSLAYSSEVPAGFSGKSLDLSAGNVAVVIQNSATSDAGYQDTFDNQSRTQITVAFWAKGFPGVWSPWVAKGGEDGIGWQVRRVDNEPHAGFTIRGLGNDDHRGSTINVNDTNWHHFVGVWDQLTGVRSLYVDGVLSHDVNTLGDVMNMATNQRLVLGGRQTDGVNFGSYFSGKLYDVRIYQQKLFSHEVQAISLPPAFLAWINANYPGLSNKSTSGDPDGDGVSNFDEFAFGLNPSSASSLSPIVSMPNATTGTFQYTRLNPAVSGLTYTVMVSTDLAEWVEDEDATAGQSVVGTNGDVQTMSVTFGETWQSETKLFVRVIAQ